MYSPPKIESGLNIGYGYYRYIDEMVSAGGGIDAFWTIYKKVSSESSYDYLRFYIDNSEQGSWAGEVDWSQSVFPVLAGNHTFKWSFVSYWKSDF